MTNVVVTGNNTAMQTSAAPVDWAAV